MALLTRKQLVDKVELTNKVVEKTFDRLVNIYNIIVNNPEEFVEEAEKIESLDIEGTGKTLLRMDDDYEYSIEPKYYRVNKITITRMKYFGDYSGYIIHFLSSRDRFTLTLPFSNISDATTAILNLELIEKIIEGTTNRDLKAELEDLVIHTRKVVSLKIKEKKVELNPDTEESLATVVSFTNIGSKLKSLDIFAEYVPSEETTIYPITATVDLFGKNFLYRIPTCNFPEFIDSFIHLLKIIGGEKDFIKFAENAATYNKIMIIAETLYTLKNLRI